MTPPTDDRHTDRDPVGDPPDGDHTRLPGASATPGAASATRTAASAQPAPRPAADPERRPELPVDAPTVITPRVPTQSGVAPQPAAGSAATPAAAPAMRPDGTANPWTGDDGLSLLPGMLLNHTYRIEALLARGGMGEVYRARNVELDTLHAVKVILPALSQHATLVDLFRREASVLRQVRHDAIVAYDGINRDEAGRLYLVMEFVDGPSLTSLLGKGPLPESDVWRLLDRLASGLAVAHDKDVVHRDISPDNIILPGGKVDAAKIIDFGISKQTSSAAATIIGDGFAGKYAYASPEQIGMFGGTVDARSDIYSLGLLLAAAAFGKPLDMGNAPQSVLQRRREVPDLSALSPALRTVLSAMLAPNPDDRPQSIASLIGAAARGGVPAGAGIPPPPPAPAPTTSRVGQQKKVGFGLIAASIAALSVLGGGAYVATTMLSAPPRQTPDPFEKPPTPAPDPTPTPIRPTKCRITTCLRCPLQTLPPNHRRSRCPPARCAAWAFRRNRRLRHSRWKVCARRRRRPAGGCPAPACMSHRRVGSAALFPPSLAASPRWRCSVSG